MTRWWPTFFVSAQIAPKMPEVLARIEGSRARFSAITDFAASRSSKLAVAQPQDGSVLLFSGSGTALASFGRRGAGPGEFRALMPMGWLADTLWVADYLNYRLTYVSPHGNLLRSVTLPSTREALQASPTLRGSYTPRLEAVYPDGTGLFSALRLSGAAAGLPSNVRTTETHFIRLTMSGDLVGMLTPEIHNRCDRRIPGAGQILPLCPVPLSAVSPGGESIALVTMSGNDKGQGNYQITVYSSAGDIRFRKNVTVPTARVEKSQRDTLIARIKEESNPQLRTLTADYVMPHYYPPVRYVLLGSSGDVWVGLWAERSATSRVWHVFDPAGTTQVETVLPAELARYAVEPRGLWAKEVDDDGLENLVLYARPRAP